jgi:hypothetical protein
MNTPRTDEYFDGELDRCPAAEFCRTLERELHECREKNLWCVNEILRLKKQEDFAYTNWKKSERMSEGADK